MGTALLALQNDPNTPVRFQLALSLGQWNDPKAATALGALPLRDAADPWIRAAVLSSATHHAAAILAAVVAHEASPAARQALVAPQDAIAQRAAKVNPPRT